MKVHQAGRRVLQAFSSTSDALLEIWLVRAFAREAFSVLRGLGGIFMVFGALTFVLMVAQTVWIVFSPSAVGTVWQGIQCIVAMAGLTVAGHWLMEAAGAWRRSVAEEAEEQA